MKRFKKKRFFAWRRLIGLILLVTLLGSYQLALAESVPVHAEINQQKQVTGKITDSYGEAIIGANVVVKGTTIGVVTDMDGNYSIGVPSDNAVLAVSYIGFVTQDVSVSGRAIVNIVLEVSAESLDEVIVVGYGTQKKVNLTGAVQNVTSADLTRRSLSNTSYKYPDIQRQI